MRIVHGYVRYNWKQYLKNKKKKCVENIKMKLWKSCTAFGYSTRTLTDTNTFYNKSSIYVMKCIGYYSAMFGNLSSEIGVSTICHLQ